MSLMVADLTTYALKTNLQIFSEANTYTERVENELLPEKVAMILNENQDIDKVVLVGATVYTENIKNRVSSLLETQYEQKKSIEIELKESWK